MRLEFIVWLTLFLVVGCGKQIGSSAIGLPGHYSVEYQHGIETLNLDADGTFTQVYTKAQSQQSITNLGTWELDKELNKVFLNGGMLFDNGEGQRTEDLQKTLWGLRVTQRLGEVILRIDDEGILEFKRVQSKLPPKSPEDEK